MAEASNTGNPRECFRGCSWADPKSGLNQCQGIWVLAKHERRRVDLGFLRPETLDRVDSLQIIDNDYSI